MCQGATFFPGARLPAMAPGVARCAFDEQPLFVSSPLDLDKRIGVERVTLEGIPLHKEGKVRQMFDLGDRFLMVATDRVSAFDVVLRPPIPDKGRVLNLLSAYWFDRTRHIVPNHMETVDISGLPFSARTREQLRDRAMIVRKLKPVPMECVVRGYLTGSGWKEYKQKGSLSGLTLPPGLLESSRLPEPIFTPTTKAGEGHDEPLTPEQGRSLIGAELFDRLQALSLELFQYGSQVLSRKGILLADTKFEFGQENGDLVLIDEVFTPDSSRFWEASSYAEGRPQQPFDKQLVRDYLERQTGWDKTPPAPLLPEGLVQEARKVYLDIYERITGERLPPTP